MEDLMVPNTSDQPCILFVTPEVAFVPKRTGNLTHYIGACSGCLGDFLAELINDLLNLGVDVHVAQPDYRKLFEILSRNEQANPSIKLPIERVHLAEDRAFFYSKPIKSYYEWENIRISLNFQREIINQIAPMVQPDLIHCHDWMTGLIPAAAKGNEVPCLFTVHNSDSAKSLLCDVEDRGIDAAAFWRALFYDRFPGNYDETRDTNALDLLLSGILAAHHVDTANFRFLPKTVRGRSKTWYSNLRQVLVRKFNAGCACEMVGIPDSSVSDTNDKKQKCNSGPNEHDAGKLKNEWVMRRSVPSYNHWDAAYRYVNMYERILQRPLVTPEKKKIHAIDKDDHTEIPDSQTVSSRKARSTQSDQFPNERVSTPAMARI
jgi:starch synthase/alpha-amylase